MKEKSEAQVFLEGFELNMVQMECKLAERQQWHDLSLSITGQMGGERVQASSDQDKMARARDKCMDMEGEILDQVYKLAEKQKEVTGVLDRLQSPIHYKILHMKYIQLKELEEIADKCRMEYTNVTTTHGRALRQVEMLMNNVCDLV